MNKAFSINQIFNIKKVYGQPQKTYEVGTTPYVTGAKDNNGVVGFVKADEASISKGNCISVDPITGLSCYQPVDFVGRGFSGASINLLYNDNLDEKTALFMCSSIEKVASSVAAYTNLFNSTRLANAKIIVPVIENPNPDHEYTVDDIDWQYMRDRITELERDRITELDAYLQSTGLNDYELTEDDKKILFLSEKRASDENGTLEDNSEDEVRFDEFALGGDNGLFNIYSPKKRFNANAITFGGKYPYVARGSSNNGIRGYITEDEKYLSPAKSLSFGQDTATVYYQPDAYFTGDKIKVMVLNNRELTPELAEYFIATIARAFSTFAWGQSSFNENIIKSMKIELPIKSDGTPDFDYMERYIRAMEKVVIADVVKYKDKVIETTKKVVGE